MRKITMLISLMLLNDLSSCSMFYKYDKIDNIVYGYNEKDNIAFIGTYEYRIGESTNITLPENYNDIPIKKLGGYTGRGYPSPFCIGILDLEDMCINEDVSILYGDMEELEEMISSGKTIIYNDIMFDIVLPSQLDEIVFCTAKYIHILTYKDGKELESPIAYRTLFNFTISDSNKYFYTEGGKLYYKKTKKIVDEFLYE